MTINSLLYQSPFKVLSYMKTKFPTTSFLLGSWYLVGTLVRGCRCAMSWHDLDLTFDLAVVTLTYNALSGPQVLRQLDKQVLPHLYVWVIFKTFKP